MPTILSRQTVGSLLFDKGIDLARAAALLSDERYAIASLEWIQTGFAKAFREYKTNLKIATYVKESNDCDDFSWHAAAYAKWLFQRMLARPAECALAFGIIWFTDGFSGVGHVINPFVSLNDKAEPDLFFFEPQNETLRVLSDAEKATCAAIIL